MFFKWCEDERLERPLWIEVETANFEADRRLRPAAGS